MRIRVTPEQLHAAASEYHSASQQTQEMVNRLTTTMNRLQPDWEGVTQQRFYADYEHWRLAMGQLAQLLQGIGQQLDTIAERFVTVDGSA